MSAACAIILEKRRAERLVLGRRNAAEVVPMNGKTIDYNTTDTLDVTVRTDKAWELWDRYKKFGWVQYASTPDSTYDNLVHISFYRPHRIEHKDELQLLQVNMEMAINNLSKAERYKNLKSMACGSIIAIITAVFVLFGTLVPVFMYSATHLAFGIICGVLAVITLAVGIPKNIKRREREEDKYNRLTLSLNAEIASACARAEELSGGINEEEISE